MESESNNVNDGNFFQKNEMQRDLLIKKLKESGCRITRQRKMLLDVILEENCSCCKEIYYRAAKKDSRIGTATVYRMIKILEEIGAIDRKNMYRISFKENSSEEKYLIDLDDQTSLEFSGENMRNVIHAGLIACGYIEGQKIKNLELCV